ncbi:uncharacterized protein [Linepithema humile]|uniref:uncharacterized protein n=1 Tax=Linepithema humile TaxID=83485 RepID=UPI00351F6941
MPNTRKSVGTVRPYRPRKKKFNYNPDKIEAETEYASTSAKKIKDASYDDIEIDVGHNNIIINFLTVFTFLSQCLKCKKCDGDVTFSRTCDRGLGFNLVIKCKCNDQQRISSSPLVNGAYEINRRLMFVMRILGLGLRSINTFCSLMELSSGFANGTYYAFITNLLEAAKSTFEVIQRKAIAEERQKNAEAGNEETHLSVSGDGSWKRRGFSSLFGIATLIGKYTHKVLDFIVKSSFCQSCSNWASKKGTNEYDIWHDTHEQHCSINHNGSAGKMEVDCMKEMFCRSESHGVKYATYIGDGDTKTFQALLNCNPYSDLTVHKKECIGHVQKRMGTRLRAAKKQHKGIEGKGAGKLTDKLIKDLTLYYGLAIRRHPDSAEEMRKAVWATFDHKCSTDEKPKHENCPPDENSWCKWRVAEAKGELADFHHEPALIASVQEAIRPIYEALSSDDLLQRCTGGNTQNDNESFNACLWKLVPKHLHCGEQTIRIAAYIASGIFNEGYSSILKTMQTLGIVIGTNSRNFAAKTDEERVKSANASQSELIKKARIEKISAQVQQNMLFEDEEGTLYGAGIAD